MSTLTNFPKKELLIILSIVVLAAILRYWDLSSVGFGNDEAIYSGQAANLAGNVDYSKFFSIYRAHPLLSQFVISLSFLAFGVSDTVGRAITSTFGILIVFMTYLVAKALFTRKFAIISAIILAILPYHITISRQVLVDVPLSFFSILTLYFVVMYIKNNNAQLGHNTVHAQSNNLWLYLTGVSAGLSFLSKEVGITVLGSALIYLALVKRLSLVNFAIICASFILSSSPFWLPIVMIDDARQGFLSYFSWQSERAANNSSVFYLWLLSFHAPGLVVIGLCMLSILYSVKIGNIRNSPILLLIIWICVPLAFLQVLPIKGYHFLMVLTPFFVILGTSFLASRWMNRIPHRKFVNITIISLILLTTGISNYVLQSQPISFAGSGGEPYIREAAYWIKNNTPKDSILLTTHTKVANIIEFYADRDAISLRGNRNPAYDIVKNGDLPIITGGIDYLVYNAEDTTQSKSLQEASDTMRGYILKYNGTPVHIEYKVSTDSTGKAKKEPVLTVFKIPQN